MLTYTATTTGGDQQEDGSGSVFEDGPDVTLLETKTYTGSGVGSLKNTSIGGFLGRLMVAIFGAVLLIGYYIDANGTKHEAPFTYSAEVSRVRVGNDTYLGVALSTNSVAPEHVPYVEDFSYGGALLESNGEAYM